MPRSTVSTRKSELRRSVDPIPPPSSGTRRGLALLDLNLLPQQAFDTRSICGCPKDSTDRPVVTLGCRWHDWRCGTRSTGRVVVVDEGAFLQSSGGAAIPKNNGGMEEKE